MHTMRWALGAAILAQAACAASSNARAASLDALARGEAAALADSNPDWVRFTLEAFRELPRYRLAREDGDVAFVVFFQCDAWRGAQTRIWFDSRGRIADWLDLGVGVRGSIARGEPRWLEVIAAVADRRFQRALELVESIDPRSTEERGMREAVRADLLHKIGRAEEAAAALAAALDDLPDHPPAWFLQGILLDEAGRSGDALAWFQRYLREVGDDPDVLAWVAKALEDSGDIEGACAAFRRGLAALPHEDWMRLRLLRLLARARRFDEIERLIEERAAFPEPMNDLVARATSEFNAEQRWEALEALSRAAPETPDSLYHLGLAMLRLGRADESREPLLRGMALDDPAKRPAYRQLLVEAFERLLDWEAAREQIDAWALEDEVSGEPQLEAARLEAIRGDPEAALPHLREALRLNSGWIRMVMTHDDFESLRAHLEK
jgi:tetratricopeptide (TPR) repeat protein